MPPDLSVVSVKPPSPLWAPCPVPVLVEVKNIGADPPARTPYDVTIFLFGGEVPINVFREIVRTPEDQQLSPGRSIVVPVQVRFPCRSPVMLRAEVDQQHQVPNNQHSASYMDVMGLSPIPVPWLTTTLRVGIRDSRGVTSFDPNAFCPGKDVVADVSIENEGCVTSKAITTEVALEDAQAAPVTLASQTYSVPALARGASHATSFSFATPSSVAGTSGALAVRVRADVYAANPDQCDRAQLNARVVKPFAAGGPPQVLLSVVGAEPIRPGEVPDLYWRVRNDCAEIGTADIKILFGAPATELYRTSVAIPLSSTVEEEAGPSRVTIPTAIASTFWQVGTKTIEMEVTGDGPDLGPYRDSAPLNVIPEPIDATWWAWDTAFPATAPGEFTGSWKSTYVVSGSISNRGLANMTVSTLSVLEHPTDVSGVAEDQTVSPIRGTVGSLVPPGGSVAAAWSLFHNWQWLLKGTDFEAGPRNRTFSYVASFSLTDEYGNKYPTIASPEAGAFVSVSVIKLNWLDLGDEFLFLGLASLVVAAGFAEVGGYAWIAAAIIAAAAMAIIILATFYLYRAYDPPIPDFREREPAHVDPQAWTISEPEDERLHPLHTLALLVTRAASAQVRAVREKDRAWAAYLDRAEPRLTHYRDNAQDELETLRRLVNATTAAVDEARETFDQLINEVDAVPTLDELREMSGRFVDELQLNDQERAIINDALATVDEADLDTSFEFARSNGLGPLSEMVRTIYETTAAEFAEHEFLRST